MLIKWLTTFSGSWQVLSSLQAEFKLYCAQIQEFIFHSLIGNKQKKNTTKAVATRLCKLFAVSGKRLLHAGNNYKENK